VLEQAHLRTENLLAGREPLKDGCFQPRCDAEFGLQLMGLSISRACAWKLSDN
jgi:hypothetical protein